jgi:hypothetical protein
MYHNEVKALQEAYSQVYEKMEYERDMDHPKTTRETKAGDPNQITTREPVKRPSTIKDKKSPKKMYPGKYQDSGGVVLGRKVRVKEELELDQMIESLVERGHTEQEAYTLVAQFTLDEAITSEKGKAKAAEMIANRTTASGRAKSGQGANVAQIKHIRRSNRDGLLGTPPNRKVAGSNWPKSYPNVGKGSKAARRAAALNKEEFEFWVDVLVEEGYDLSDYTWDEMYEFYLDESQAARNNPEKYEREQSKKYAPVRGERLLCHQEVISVERTLRSGMLSKWVADK